MTQEQVSELARELQARVAKEMKKHDVSREKDCRTLSEVAPNIIVDFCDGLEGRFSAAEVREFQCIIVEALAQAIQYAESRAMRS